MSRRSHLSGVLILVVSLCCVSHAQTESWRTFRDAKNGVTFRYPSGWTLNSDSGADLLFESDDQMIQGVSLFRTNKSDDKISATSYSFLYGILTAKSADACRRRVLASLGSDSRGPNEFIHGTRFAVYESSDAGLGHSIDQVVYTAFRNTHCYTFTLVTDSMVEVDDESKASSKFGLEDILKTIRIPPVAPRAASAPKAR